MRCAPAGRPGDLTPGAYWGAGLPLPAPPAQRHPERRARLHRRLDDLLDALGDLSLAESVYQIMRGNFGRSGGILAAVSRGDQPPEPDLVDTPRRRHDVTHRLMLLFAGAPAAAPRLGAASPPGPRAARRALASTGSAACCPSRAPCAAPCPGPTTAAASPPRSSLRDLGVGPLDVLALADAGRPRRSGSELETASSTRRRRPPTPTASRSATPTAACRPAPSGSPTCSRWPRRCATCSAPPARCARRTSPARGRRGRGGGATDLAELNASAAGAGEPARRRQPARCRRPSRAIAPRRSRYATPCSPRAATAITGSVPQPADAAAALATRAADSARRAAAAAAPRRQRRAAAADPAGAPRSSRPYCRTPSCCRT